MADGGWRMADGGWRMADGGWRMADGMLICIWLFGPVFQHESVQQVLHATGRGSSRAKQKA